MNRWLPLVLFALVCSVGFSAYGADWPQFRCDANRSAFSTEALPASLSLQWVRRLPSPRPAFPGEVRLWFDASYEPVVCSGTMFVPSMVTDSVAALDVETGAERWKFFAEGPVRFAPVAWEGSVYLVSDDGYLYCIGAGDGKLRWKFRSLAPGKHDRKVLGSGRLISLFPARGGPVLKDGVLYFAAGLWPGYGVAVHALDARSGRAVWSNMEVHRIPKANMDHGIATAAGLTPQGYLAIVNDTLVIPCGAQLPAFLDLKTGAVRTYSAGWGGREGLPKGTWFVAGDKHYLSHSGDLYDLARPADERFAKPWPGPDFKNLLYPGGFTRLWIDPANQKDLKKFQEPVFGPEAMYTGDDGIAAYNLGDLKLEERTKERTPAVREKDTYPDRWQMTCRELWKMPSKLGVHVKAGPHLYVGGPGVVEAVRVPQPGEQPQVAWRGTIEGTPQRMLAASGKLFVVTREGAICAFGGDQRPAPAIHAPPAAPAPPADAWTKTAADILRTTNVRSGYAVVLGIGTGRLVEELARQSSLDVIAVDRDGGKVEQLRHRLYSAGLYGTRASVHVGDPLTFPFPPYLASVVVSEDWTQVGSPEDPRFVEAVFHPLRPYGGTVCLAVPEAQRDRVVEAVANRASGPANVATLVGASARKAGDWVLLCRAGPLPGAADWTHEEADAGNSGASAEQFVRTPLELLWFDTPPRSARTPGSTLARVCCGRMFLKTEKLLATDVFTGRRLWETPLPWRPTATDQMVVAEDAIYVASAKTCLVFDPETGRKTAQFDLPADLTGTWTNLRVWQGQLVGQCGEHLVCVDRRNGQVTWKHQCARAKLSLAVGGGKVFCSEVNDKRFLATAEKEDFAAFALDVASGKLLWQVPGGSEVRYCAALDLVVLASGIHGAQDGSLLAKLPQQVLKPASKAGPETLGRPLCVIGTTLLFGNQENYVEYDLRTGRTTGDAMVWTRRGCTLLRASANLVTTRFRGNAACIDLASREVFPFWGVRAACCNNLFPASGVLNMPSLSGGCTCNYLPVSQVYVHAAAVPRNGGTQ